MATIQQIVGLHGLSFAAGGLLSLSYTDAVTAHAGGGQGSAVQLAATITNVTVVGSTGDSVKLPPPSAYTDPNGPVDSRGVVYIVGNTASNTLAVFPDSGSTINGGSANASVNVPAGAWVFFWQTSAGAWFTQDMSAQLVSTLIASGMITANGGLTLGAAQYLINSSTTAITAGTTRTQAGATVLSGEVNRIDTSTAPTAGTILGDGVKLPAAFAGAELIIWNNTANPVQLYPNGSDTINGVAGATGIAIPPNAVYLVGAAATGAWIVDGTGSGTAGALPTQLFCAGITAHSGGGQGSAVALPALINRVATVAAQGDSVALPAATAGLAITVENRGAFPMQVFGAGTDTINAIATATGISQGVNTTAVYICTVAGNWEVPITSLQSTSPQSLSSGSPALPPHVGHTYVITKGSAMAATLAAPTAGTDDGIEITLTSSTAFAHSLTATGLLQTGTASVNTATFAANAGAGLTLMAFNAKWIVLASVGITFS